MIFFHFLYQNLRIFFQFFFIKIWGFSFSLEVLRIFPFSGNRMAGSLNLSSSSVSQNQQINKGNKHLVPNVLPVISIFYKTYLVHFSLFITSLFFSLQSSTLFKFKLKEPNCSLPYHQQWACDCISLFQILVRNKYRVLFVLFPYQKENKAIPNWLVLWLLANSLTARFLEKKL